MVNLQIPTGEGCLQLSVTFSLLVVVFALKVLCKFRNFEAYIKSQLSGFFKQGLGENILKEEDSLLS